MDLGSKVENIKGVGTETAKKFEKLGIETIRDLLTFWPRRYEDYSEVIDISQIQPGTVTIKARVESIKSHYAKRGIHITEAVLRDDTGAIKVVWFNQPYRERYFKPGQEYYFSGLYDFSYNRYVLQNPTVEQVKDFTKNTARIVPIYHQTKGLSSRDIRKFLASTTPLFPSLNETLPQRVIDKNKLMNFAQAAKQMHWPEDVDRLAEARQRIGFEEVFSYVLAAQINKRDIAEEVALRIEFSQQFARDYTQALPFKLTPDQKRSAWEILQDIDSEKPMNRLLEGDVGAGKTVVASMAAFMASKQGIQSAFMAPTELLAQQHSRTLANLLEPLGVKLALLTASTKPKARSVLYKQLEQGGIDIIIGTHALLQEKVRFKRLGMIVVDEQHRFGVKQRQKLVDKAKKVPHILSMTATPIPRSLALTIYGELDISIIAHKPSNRLPIMTHIVSPNSRAQLYDRIDVEITNGRQVFVVCPLIDDGDMSEIRSVSQEISRLKSGPFKHRKIGSLHGRMKDNEKAKIMKTFVAGELDILVSTTVIEVGIDIPNASVMLIESADLFGLAQLHQLRGRVGRGEYQGFCYLIPSTSKKPSKRLRAMERTYDGFKLAEMDLEIRGPGAIYGTRQHGKLDLKIANITDIGLIKSAKNSAIDFLESGEKLNSYPELSRRVNESLSLTYLN